MKKLQLKENIFYLPSKCRQTCDGDYCRCNVLLEKAVDYKDFTFEGELVYEVEFEVEDSLIIELHEGDQVNFNDCGYPANLKDVHPIDSDYDYKELTDNLEEKLEDGSYKALVQVSFEETGWEVVEWESFGWLTNIEKI